MDSDDKQLLLTAAWMFARHGQGPRARVLCEALVEDDPRDGLSAAALAELLLADGEAERALNVLRTADFPPELDRAEALLEARALTALGKKDEAARRWKRHLAASKGGRRQWI